jgi:hypothetical protein
VSRWQLAGIALGWLVYCAIGFAYDPPFTQENVRWMFSLFWMFTATGYICASALEACWRRRHD